MIWSEDDFLERLMPALRRERGGSNGACPDAATVRAAIEGEASDWLRNAYAQHLAHCFQCSELDNRLRNFDRPVLVKDEAEWKQTEKRLDNWLGAHLQSTAAASRRAAEERASRPGFWESIWRPGRAWKISSALGLVALFAITAGVYVKSRRHVPPQQAKAPALATPAAAPGIPLPAENSHPKSEAPQSTEPQMASAPQPPAQAKPQPEPAETATATGNAGPSEPQQQAALKPPARKHRDIGKDQKAAIDQARQRASRRKQAEKEFVVVAGAKETERAASPQEQATTAKEAAKPPRPGAPAPAPQLQASATPHSNRSAATAYSSRASPNGARTVALPPSAVPDTGMPPSAIVAPDLPVSLHLGAGVRLWIVLASVNRQADGSFSFRGSLLLPLKTAGSSPLARDTEVSGEGTVAGGRTSLLISEIVIQGNRSGQRPATGGTYARQPGAVVGRPAMPSGKVSQLWTRGSGKINSAIYESRYKLKPSADSGQAQTTGSGGVVPFDSGKVLEMWLSSDSTYEREPAAESPKQ